MTAKINQSPLPEKARFEMFSQTVVAISLVFALAACSQQSAEQAVPKVPGPAGKVLATVNGYPITEYDVRIKLQIKDPELDILPDSLTMALDELITEELKYRKAIKLGLDKDQGFQMRIADVMANVNYLKRDELGRLFHKDQVIAKAAVSDEEARKFFDGNKEMIQTEINVWQILSDNSDDMENVQNKIKGGISFLDAAKARFQKLPNNVTPWDVGYLHWNQIPDMWREEISRLKNGEVSGLIKGPRGRIWLIKLNDKRIDPSVNFENQKRAIQAYLAEKRKQELAKTTIEELRKNAKIVYQNK